MIVILKDLILLYVIKYILIFAHCYHVVRFRAKLFDDCMPVLNSEMKTNEDQIFMKYSS